MKFLSLKTQQISRHRSFIYGAAALMIMFFHFGTNIPNRGLLKILRIFQDLGCCGVEMFLLLTGFGLVRSLKRDPSRRRFLARRLSRILPPLFICALAFDILLYSGPYAAAVGKGFFLDYLLSSAVWYVSFIALMYLAFPCIESLRRKSPAAIHLLTILLAILSFVLESAADFPRESEIMRMFSRIPVFLLGCALAPWETENRPVSRLSLPCLLPLSAILIAAWRKNLLPGAYYSLRTLCFTVCAMTIILLLGLLAEGISGGRIYRFFAFCGACSLEIYLVFARIRAVLPMLPVGGSFASIKMDFAAVLITLPVSALILRISRSLTKSIQ